MNKLLRNGILILLIFSIAALFIGCGSNENTDQTEGEETAEQTENISGTEASGEITDAEITAFITIYQKMYGLQKKFQMQAMQVVQQSGMPFEKYQTIAQTMQNQGEGSVSDFTDAEMTSFNEIEKELKDIESKLQSESLSFFNNETITQERYQQIGEKSRLDTLLQQRLQVESDKLRQEQMQKMQQQQQMQQMPPQQMPPQNNNK